MEWTWIHVAYLFFAVIHPISELIPATSLQKFLNLDYYPTQQENFPVSRVAGIVGSLFVLVLLILPPFRPGLWYLVLGLAFADLIQHTVHVIRGEQKTAPLVHLLTILPICILIPILPHPALDLSNLKVVGWVLLGALIIFGNWGLNTLRVNMARAPRPA